MSWVAVAVAGSAAVGAGASMYASNNASNAQQAATDQAVNASNAQYQQTRADQGVARTAGNLGTTRLQYLLGLGNPAAASNPTLAAAQSGTLTAIGPGGIPAMNPMLASDPLYARAWNDVAAMHRNGMGSDYTAGSDPNWINSMVAQRYQELGGGQQQLGSGLQMPQSGGDYGSLLKTFTANDLQNDPVYQASYQAGLDMGAKALTRRLGATTGTDNGGALKALTRYATDYTNQSAGAAYDRFNQNQTNTYNRLAGIAGLGQTASNTTAQTGAQNASTLAGLYSSMGNAQGAANIAQGNALSGSISGIGNYFGQQQTLNKILAQRNGGQQQVASAPAYDFSTSM